ncbi:MAG: hypothetical protein M0P69_16135 [Bacteroidales bacterium]|nr:hypothetical protein [Bacteroidales bacterium]
MVGILNPSNFSTCMRAAINGTPIAKVGYYTGTAEEYQELAKWEVTENKIGYLGTVNLQSIANDNALFKIIINTTTVIEDAEINGTINLKFPEGSIVESITVFAKSDGVKTIASHASITGKEV